MRHSELGALLVSLVACGNVSPLPGAGAGGVTGGGGQPSAGTAPATGQSGAASGAGASSLGSAGANSAVGGNTSVGGASTGSAGTAGTAGATAGSAGSGGSLPMLESPPGFFTGGYLMSGPWMGWVFTYTDGGGKGTTVSPVCDANGCNPAWGAQACLKGSVGKDAASATFVGLAFHNNNPMSGGTGTWTVSGQGVYISVSNPPPVARVQLQEPNTSSNDQRYCAPLPAGGTGLIPFSSFKTYCWGDTAHTSKVLAAGTQIHETAIVVPGNAAADTQFDFCLVDIEPK